MIRLGVGVGSCLQGGMALARRPSYALGYYDDEVVSISISYLPLLRIVLLVRFLATISLHSTPALYFMLVERHVQKNKLGSKDRRQEMNDMCWIVQGFRFWMSGIANEK